MSKIHNVPLAICSYAHRLPGGLITDEDYWILLKNRGTVRANVKERYGKGFSPLGKYPDANLILKSKYEGLITNNREWNIDPVLFGMSMMEALSMDPQQRMLLACSWEALERAGWSHQSLHNSDTGVFIGCQVPSAASWRNHKGGNIYNPFTASLAINANRISFQFNLKGPSVAYATACSAGLTAFNAAAQSIRLGDCRQALVGGVSHLGAIRMSISFGKLGVISPDGRSFSLDERANGYLRSEGAFVFTIKPVQYAEEDGDEILAVLESTALNTAGAADQAKGLAPARFISAPTRHAQVDVMKKALALANRSPREIDYVEMHATGTSVGDVIEGNSVAEAYGDCDRKIPLRISSVKSNIGHMEAAAFCGSLLKVLFMIQRRTYAPISENFVVPNPEIDFEKGPMVVQTFAEPFPEKQVVFGISSFGFGGANGHCIVSEYMPESKRVWSIPVAPDAGYMIPLSARTNEMLVQTIKDFHEYLSDSPVDLYTLAGNLSRRRTHHQVRTAFSARSMEELRAKFGAFLEDDSPSINHPADGPKRVAFVFSGQGTQWAGCAKTLYDTQPTFKRTMDEVDRIWQQYSDVSLREVCFGASQEDLDRVDLAQSTVFLVQVALVELLKTWGVYPDVVTGHSSGEVAAAYSSGLLTLEEAVRVAHCRAVSQRSLEGSGKMLPIGLGQEAVQELLLEVEAKQVEIVCLNSPIATVVSGTEEALEPVIAICQKRKIQHTLLRGNIAFHSSAMESIRETILEEMEFLNACTFERKIPFISTVTGKEEVCLDAEYWWNNVRQPVQFLDAITTIRTGSSPDIYLEISPHQALSSMVAQCYESTLRPPQTIPTLLRDGDGRYDFLDSLGKLFSAGLALNYEHQFPRPFPVTNQLPGHPVNWIQDVMPSYDDEMSDKSGGNSHGPLVGRPTIKNQNIFESIFSSETIPFLKDHRVDGISIIPGMGYVELVLEAVGGDSPIKIEEIEFFAQCPIEQEVKTLITALTPVSGREDVFDFKISTRSFEDDSEDQIHAWGRVRRFEPKDWVPDGPKNAFEMDLDDFPEHLYKPIENFYEALEVILMGQSFEYGPDFRILKEIRLDESGFFIRAESEVDLDFFKEAQEAGFIFLPQMLDAGVQIFLGELLLSSELFGIPRRVTNITYIKPPTSNRLIYHLSLNISEDHYDHRGQDSTEFTGDHLSGNIRFYDAETGDILLELGAYYTILSIKDATLKGKTKFVTTWQPKFLEPIVRAVPDAPALIDALSSKHEGIPQVHRIMEYAGSNPPKSTQLYKSCLDALTETQHEYWLVSSSRDRISEHYDEFSHRDACVRIVEQDFTNSDLPDFARGPLREHSISLLLLGDEQPLDSPEIWSWCERLVVPKGLVVCPVIPSWTPGEAWNILAQDDHYWLLQAPEVSYVSEYKDRSHWIFGGAESLAVQWAEQHPSARLIDHFDEAKSDWEEIASVEAIDFFCPSEPDPEDPVGEKLAWRLTSFLQSFVQCRKDQKEAPPTRLTVVTQGAAYQVKNLQSYIPWGVIRCIGIEHGFDEGIDFRLVDIGDESDLTVLRWLAEQHLRERELAIRDQRIWVPRLVRIKASDPLVAEDQPVKYRLNLKSPGQISGVEWQASEEASLGANEVQVEVAAAPLNFRDIMVILNLLPPLAYESSALGNTVGIEGSGVVVATGDQVTRVAVGDSVCYTFGNSIGNFLTLPEELLCKVPESCSLIEAASSMSVLQTAYYALVHEAGLRPRHTVLIHSAMGGVGQVAIQLVKMVGASFYATAGNPEKRTRLRDMGALDAFDSHSFEWHHDLMEATDGQGVDIVLNSLAGEHLFLSLESLKPGGWHCEIGKVDIYANHRIDMRVLRKNIHIAAIDMDRLALEDPELTKEIAMKCLELLGSGKVKPPEITCYDFADLEKAFRFMMSGKHEGKLVLVPPKGKRGFPVVDKRNYFDSNGTYLVTGASGGLGTRILRYLAFCGAHHVTVIDRDPERKRSVDGQLEQIRSIGFIPDFEVRTVYGEITEIEQVKSIIDELDRPLKGVFHLAGSLNDQLLANLTEEAMSDVFRPKALGAWNLHQATEHLTELDHFVMFSSSACLLGNIGQSNYAGANAFMDALAAYRVSQGLPGLSFNLAGIRNVGMASRSPSILRSMEAIGLPAISSTTAIANLDYAIRTMGERDHIASFMVENPGWMPDHPDYLRIGHLQSNQSAFAGTLGGELTVKRVLGLISAKLAKLAGYDEINPEASFSDYGLTSISVTELSAFIHKTFRYRASHLELMTASTPLILAEAIVQASITGNGSGGQLEEDSTQNEVLEVSMVNNQSRIPSKFAIPVEEHFEITAEHL